METQTELLAELEASEIYQVILKLIENNPQINLRNLALLSNYSPQDVWSALVDLKERKIVESVTCLHVTCLDGRCNMVYVTTFKGNICGGICTTFEYEICLRIDPVICAHMLD